MKLKDRVLEALEQNRGLSVSGEQLAQELGVTRAAVWKAIRALRDEGYGIEAGTNRGYSLPAGDGKLSAQGIRAHLTPRLDETELVVFDSVDSTNTEGRRRIAAGAKRELLLVANEQTAGRGRRGNSFFSPKDSGLYLSAVLFPHKSMADTALATVAAAVATCRAIEKVSGGAPRIKWVNDVFWNGKKVCGILTEAVSDFESGTVEALVVGIGVNVTREEFPPALQKVAASLELDAAARNRLAAEIANELFALMDRLGDASLIEAYKARSLVLGKRVRYERSGQAREGIAADINERGNLVVRLDDGSLDVLGSGEISLGSGNWADDKET